MAEYGQWLNAQLLFWLNTGQLWVAGGVVILATLAYVILGRDKPLRPVAVQGVPRGLSALEVGTAIEGIVQGEDLGAQLFDWAVGGHVALRVDAAGWRIQAGQPLSPQARAYEKEAWGILFRKGRTEVCPSCDHNDILRATLVLQKGAEARFAAGENRLTESHSAHVAVIVWLAGALCLAAAGAFAAMRRGTNIYGAVPYVIVSVLPSVLAAWLSGWLQRYYQVRSRRRNILVVITLLLCDLVMGVLLSYFLATSLYAMRSVVPLVAAGIFAAMLAPFVSRRSDYGHQLLEEIMGLRDALADSEGEPGRAKEESAEDYFYRMLPYAQVLGVGDAFVARHMNLKLSCPPWLSWELSEPLTAQALRRALVGIRDMLIHGQLSGR